MSGLTMKMSNGLMNRFVEVKGRVSQYQCTFIYYSKK
jgi:hypothetical protein